LCLTIDMCNTTDVTSGAGTAYPSGALSSPLVCSGFMLFNL